MTLNEVVCAIRALYPEAASAQVFVTESDFSVETNYRYSEVGATYKQLNGEWCPRKDGE